MNGYHGSYEPRVPPQQQAHVQPPALGRAVSSQYSGPPTLTSLETVMSSAPSVPPASLPNGYAFQNSTSAMTAASQSNGGWSVQGYKQKLPAHIVSPFGVATSSIGAATAAANLSSLVNVTSDGDGAAATASYTCHSVAVAGQQPMLYQNANGTAYPASVSMSNANPTYSTRAAHLPPTENGPPPNLNSPQEQLLRVQKELEKERGLRYQLQQRVIELTQCCHGQQFVEKSYEDLSMKYTHAYAQLQKLSAIVQRYSGLIKQLEQENRMLAAENSSLKALENSAHDKTMLYNMLMERSKKLEEENSGLVLENENYQRQYEKTIDQISNNVVQALLTQKALQEQCIQLQDRLNSLEKENGEWGDAVRQARQASSESRLVWTYRGGSGRSRAHTASPSADSVRSMPAQHLYWRQGSAGSLEQQQQQGAATADSQPLKEEAETQQQQFVCVETEFPANNSSPKSTRRSLDRHPSSGSLDAAVYHSKSLVKAAGHDVRCQRSVSAEALRDMKVNMKCNVDLTLPTSLMKPPLAPAAASAAAADHPPKQSDSGEDSPPAPLRSRPADSRPLSDPFADDADDILSKHQSLIVGSMDDIFSTLNGDLKNDVIHEETSAETSGRSAEEVNSPPTPPPRPGSRCLSESSFTGDGRAGHAEPHSVAGPRAGEGGSAGPPPPLPPKQYKGSRRAYKPLPAEPDEAEYDGDDVDSSDKNTDSESIKQEINALTSKIARMASYHK